MVLPVRIDCMRTKEMPRRRNGATSATVVVLLLLRALLVVTTASADNEATRGTVNGTVDDASPGLIADLLGVSLPVQPGTHAVFAHARDDADQIGTLRDAGTATGLATDPPVQRWELETVDRSRHWVLVDLVRTGVSTGDGRKYGWVRLDAFRSAEPPWGEVMYGPEENRGLLYRQPGYGLDPVEMFYVNLDRGEIIPQGVLRWETRLDRILEPTEVLVYSAGTGPGSPQLIYLQDLTDGSRLFGGNTWRLHDAIRDDRYVRVIPGTPWREVPGYRKDPPEEDLREEPYRFSAADLERYRRLHEQTRRSSFESVHIVPQAWFDTVTGEIGPTEYTIEHHVEQ